MKWKEQKPGARLTMACLHVFVVDPFPTKLAVPLPTGTCMSRVPGGCFSVDEAAINEGGGIATDAAGVVCLWDGARLGVGGTIWIQCCCSCCWCCKGACCANSSGSSSRWVGELAESSSSSSRRGRKQGGQEKRITEEGREERARRKEGQTDGWKEGLKEGRMEAGFLRRCR